MGGYSPLINNESELEGYYIITDQFMSTLGSIRDYVETCFDFDRTFPYLQIFLREQFINWMQKPVYLVYENKETKDIVFRQASKRGNRAYLRRNLKRLNPVKDALMKLDDSYFLNKTNRKLKTKSLFITLTVKPDIFLWNRKKFWKTIGRFYDNFVRAIVAKYGKAFVMRGVIESTRNGFPHIHLIMIFKDKEFSSFRHMNRKTEKVTYRIHEKRDLEKYWQLGFIDVQAIKNRYQASGYIVKYGVKGYDVSKCSELERESIELTLTLNWYFRKHSFTFRYLNLLFYDLIFCKQNSHNSLESHPARLAEDWTFLGIVYIGCVVGNEKLPPIFFVVAKNSILGEEVLNHFERLLYG